MRKMLFTVLLAGLVSVPVVAQRPGGGGPFGRGMDVSAMLLGNPEVQKELKLDDDQKKALASATKEMRDAQRKAFEDKDFESMPKVMEAYTKAVAKVKSGLKPEQKKRLLGIEVQQAEKMGNLTIFKKDEVVKALKLTDKQQETIKETTSNAEKDTKELFEDAQGDRAKMQAAFRKMQTMGKENFAKVAKTFTEDQKIAWKELKGDEIKLNLFGPGGGRGKGRPKKDGKDGL